MGRGMSLVVKINGREAIPVRALCFVAGRKRLSPDVVAGAAYADGHYSGKGALPTYQLVDGVVQGVAPDHWALFCEAIESASLLLREKGLSPRATRTQWLHEATMLLPSGVFVWLDEFQDWFRRTRPYRMEVGVAGLQLEQPEEGRLSLMPPIADGLKSCLREGFPLAFESPAAPTPEQPASIEPEPMPAPASEQAVGKEGQRAAGPEQTTGLVLPTIRTHKIKSRVHALDAVIELAKQQAINPTDYQSTWAALVKMAESECPPPLYGYSSDGIKYRGKKYEESGVPDVFTKDALRMKMNRSAR